MGDGRACEVELCLDAVGEGKDKRMGECLVDGVFEGKVKRGAGECLGEVVGEEEKGGMEGPFVEAAGEKGGTDVDL